MKLVYTIKHSYHLTDKDNFNHTVFQPLRVLCGKMANVRISQKDIADIIKAGSLCKQCHQVYRDEIKAGRA